MPPSLFDGRSSSRAVGLLIRVRDSVLEDTVRLAFGSLKRKVMTKNTYEALLRNRNDPVRIREAPTEVLHYDISRVEFEHRIGN